MNKIELLNDADLLQLKSLGISPEKILAEIKTFKRGAPYLKLDRPCTVGDGIKQIDEDEIRDLVDFFTEAAVKKELLKFVPASGAASRMFKVLLQAVGKNKQIRLSEVAARAESGDTLARQLMTFMLNIKKFAFFTDLKEVMAADDLDVELLLGEGEFKDIIEYLLTDRGLNYSARPKGLIKFHSYSNGGRTAFAEHLLEAANYTCGSGSESRLHFTVSPEHKAGFTELLAEIRDEFENEYGVRLAVDFSEQEKATDTIAVDLENRLFREADGKLLFRPGGHGALLENLNRLSADIIFIKNIDNVVPDRLKDETFLWKKVLCGHLLKVQQQIFNYIGSLKRKSVSTELIEKILAFIRFDLSVLPPADFDVRSDLEKRDFLVGILNRPIRVCGMVRNEGEPGGGPFWVEGNGGLLSLQIVEGAQINPEAPDQQKILQKATHFNPVDLVCGVKDWQGKLFDLKKYVDPDAVFIARKSKDGRDLKALELPGIWNGAMAYWNTIFIEVPLITFNPVKSVNDLLRDEHQSE